MPSAGASKSQCKCSAKEIRKKYPAEEFENMMENIIRTGKNTRVLLGRRSRGGSKMYIGVEFM